ncbi:MAG TPA: DUF4290 domain-containing protein, partial [Bacteroidales bacterium]|nr:DUF4290 domain-containing protein [Bacteroidales bacterium]
KMDYPTLQGKLIMPEYGRNIQQMISHALTIEDREERTRCVKTVINIMGNMFPYLRDVNDFKHKLWDHLHIISEFKLDVDSPYEAPTQEALQARPAKVPYSSNHIKYRMYGSNIARIIEKTVQMEDGYEKEALVHAIANHLKKSYLNWNRESVDDDQIFEHLKVLSKGQLELREDQRLSSTNEILSRNKKKKPVKQPQKGPQMKRKKKRM